jgi:hypothetical protein
MLISIEGVYRNGKVELKELPANVNAERRVIVTFVEPKFIDLRERGIDEAQAADLRARLATFAEDWNSPEMDIYDNYDAAKANLPARWRHFSALSTFQFEHSQDQTGSRCPS